MTLGRQLRRPELPTAGARWCEAALPEGSVYRFLARERARLFPPELFADLFQPTGRRSVPPSILAVVMVLQRLEGLSDREAADRFAFDAMKERGLRSRDEPECRTLRGVHTSHGKGGPWVNSMSGSTCTAAAR